VKKQFLEKACGEIRLTMDEFAQIRNFESSIPNNARNRDYLIAHFVCTTLGLKLEAMAYKVWKLVVKDYPLNRYEPKIARVLVYQQEI
jgi:hypothetical protein